MNSIVLLTTDVNPFMEIVKPIVSLINMAAGPLLLLVGALGTLYCIFLGVKLAKAEEPQDREKAKGALKNAIVGFILVFVLIAALNLAAKPLTKWMNEAAGTSINVESKPAGKGTKSQAAGS